MYDVVYFLEQHKDEARKLVKPLPPEQAHRVRNPALGLRVVEPVAIPRPDGTKSTDTGVVYFTAAYGSLAFDPTDPESLILEEIKPGLVVGNFPPGFYESPAAVKAAADEQSAEAGYAIARPAAQAKHDAERADEVSHLIAAHCVELAQLAGVKPKKINGKRIQAITARIAEAAPAGGLAALILEHWKATATPPPVPDPDPLTLARMARNTVVNRTDVHTNGHSRS